MSLKRITVLRWMYKMYLLSAGDIFCQLSNTDLNFSTRVAVNETETRPNQTNRNAKKPTQTIRNETYENETKLANVPDHTNHAVWI